MNFCEFKTIMNDLEALNYVKVKEYKNHCFVKVLKQENNETTKLVSDKIENIWENSEIVGGYDKIYGQFIFMETDNFIKCFEEESYEKIINKINELNPSFVKVFVEGYGVDKAIKLYAQKDYGVGNSWNSQSFESKIYSIIDKNLPKDAHYYGRAIKTDKGKKWEEKKMNCAEIKICEDFDKILSRY